MVILRCEIEYPSSVFHGLGHVIAPGQPVPVRPGDQLAFGEVETILHSPESLADFIERLLA